MKNLYRKLTALLAAVLHRMVRRNRERRRAQAIARIRGHFAAFGYSLDELADEEVEKRINEAQRVVSVSGLSIKEALEGMAAIAKCFSLNESSSPTAADGNGGAERKR